jgi:hypothetical protein
VWRGHRARAVEELAEGTCICFFFFQDFCVVYAVAVPMYVLEPKDLPKSKSHPIATMLIAIGPYVSMDLAWRWLNLSHPRESMPSTILRSVFQGTIVGLAFIWIEQAQREKQYELVVDEHQMSTRYSFFSHPRVRRDQVRTIIEKRSGLFLSERSRIGMGFLGGLWIPKTLPEYESLKSLALSWKTKSRTPGSS